jgi:hypothetical protein
MRLNAPIRDFWPGLTFASLWPCRIVRLPIERIGLCRGADGLGPPLNLQGLLTWAAKCRGDAGVALQVLVLPRIRDSIEYNLETVRRRNANQSSLRTTIGSDRPDRASLRARMYDSNSALSMITRLRHPRAPQRPGMSRLPDVCPRITNRLRKACPQVSRSGRRPRQSPAGTSRLHSRRKEGRLRLAHTAAVADHHDRISNSDFRWHSASQFATRVESGLQNEGETEGKSHSLPSLCANPRLTAGQAITRGRPPAKPAGLWNCRL